MTGHGGQADCGGCAGCADCAGFAGRSALKDHFVRRINREAESLVIGWPAVHGGERLMSTIQPDFNRTSTAQTLVFTAIQTG
jgi:hypothetical protein